SERRFGRMQARFARRFGFKSGRLTFRKAGIWGAVLLLVHSAAAPAFALPTGGTVTQGSGTIETVGGHMDVTQTSEKLVIDWNTFDIAAGESVEFHQPGPQAVALNRVLDVEPSEIFGKLDANG